MLRLSLTMTLRDWRAGELRFLLVALMLSISSLCAVGFFSDRMRTGLERDAHQMLAADMVINTEHAIDSRWAEDAKYQGLRTATTMELSSMAIAGEGDAVNAKLVALKAVSNTYPLRGALKVRAGTESVSVSDIPASGTVWVDPAVLSSLHLELGGKIKLGEQKFTVARIIAAEPDRGAAFSAFVPRVLMNIEDMAATHLIQDGADINYRLLVAGDAKAVAGFQHYVKTAIVTKKIIGLSVETIESRNANMQEALSKARQFLSLSSLLSTLLGAVAVAIAARRFMLRHVDACAVMRCLGLTQGRIAAIYLLEFLLIALLGGFAGILLGYAGHYALVEYLGKLITAELPPADWQPALQGLVASVILLIGFALPPMLHLRNIPHSHLIRRESHSPKTMSLIAYLLGVIAIIGLLLWQAGDIKLGLLVAAGFLVSVMVFSGLAWLSLMLLKRGRLSFNNSSWRFAITALLRRPATTIVQLVAVALGLSILLLLTVVRSDLMASWENLTPAGAPNHFIINIQPDQKNAVEARLQGVGRPPLYPVIRGRLIAVNGKVVTADTYTDELAKKAVNREMEISSVNTLPTGDKITAGHWYANHNAGTAEISVTEDFAKFLHARLGDKLSFDIAGQQLTATISSLRTVDPNARSVYFPFYLNPNAAADLPRTWVTTFYSDDADGVFTNKLTEDYPNLSIFDIAPIIKQIQTVLQHVATAIEFLFLFTMASGLLVLYITLAGSQDLRRQENALLRALGATRRQLTRAQWIEYTLMGSLAGLLAAGTASAMSWVLAHYVLKVDWHFSAILWICGLLAGASCALIGGWASLRDVLKHPPLLTLREV